MRVFSLTLPTVFFFMTTMSSCQTLKNIENWFIEELIPESLLQEYPQKSRLESKVANIWEGYPIFTSVFIELIPQELSLYAAYFETDVLAIGAYLELRNSSSQALKVKQNYWASHEPRQKRSCYLAR